MLALYGAFLEHKQVNDPKIKVYFTLLTFIFQRVMEQNDDDLFIFKLYKEFYNDRKDDNRSFNEFMEHPEGIKPEDLN